MQAKLIYLNHEITVTLPDPAEDNTVKVCINKLPGTYDEILYNAYLTNFQFSGDSVDPNNWILEALEAAIKTISGYGTVYAEITTGEQHSSEDLGDNPF
ncbi:hypothetical protein Cylst_5240 [Cylindrospermum stagnale PCC 7417]|uniref:Uncharacterized protein n=1 Tax=Cylindrospermum stagnale PCC 7417 TaxID=56107 RepID=K9X594_9NOST|nr:hypothetical protein [Cylindrospermum stagnale]AFZ27274.1 hypothetical protein Cylst_5240 [Cylindrospermum stagnale PCC 7417]